MILIAILTLGSVALVFGTILAIADVKLQVIENPKISEINEILPQARSEERRVGKECRSW